MFFMIRRTCIRIVLITLVFSLAPSCSRGGDERSGSGAGAPETSGTATGEHNEGAPSSEGGAQEEEPAAVPPSPAAANPADAAFRDFGAEVVSATNAIVAAATGASPDPRWVRAGDSEGLLATTAVTVGEVNGLGTPSVLMTVLEVEAIGTDTAGTTHYLRGSAAVFPDGRVRFVRAATRTGEVMVSRVSDLATRSAALDSGVRAFIDGVRGGCTLPIATEADLAGLPEAPRADLLSGLPSIQATCASLASVDAQWVPRLDDITVATQTGDTTVMLRSGFSFSGPGVGLAQVRSRAIE